MLFDVGHETEHGSSLGLKYLINDAGYVTSVGHGPAVHHASTAHHAASLVPAPTLVSDPGGGDLEIKLIWDSSVARAPSGFTRTVIAAAELYVQEFATTIAAIGNEVINIQIGYGELAGSAMSPAALGESQSLGLLTGYATVTHALGQEGYSFKAANEPRAGQFFVTSAEAKALGLIDPASGGVDGFVGFSTLAGTGYHWNLTAASSCSTTGTGTRPRQFDLESVVWHEISEVMGRIGMEGELVNGHATYTPLDLFDFKSPGELALSPNGGYFSVDNGRTPLGRYNNAAVHGGDISDWASLTIRQSATWGRFPRAQDAYDAFGFPGIDGVVSLSDLAEVASLGYGSLSVAEAIV